VISSSTARNAHDHIRTVKNITMAKKESRMELLEEEQVLLSKERTILSFMRTGLAFVTAGVVLAGFFDELRMAQKKKNRRAFLKETDRRSRRAYRSLSAERSKSGDT
jgi:uncharacterized membrane protein YidH (DUF202 family)